MQVCNDITNLETRTRELRPFIALNDSILKILVVNKPLEEIARIQIDEDFENTIKHKKLNDKLNIFSITAN